MQCWNGVTALIVDTPCCLQQICNGWGGRLQDRLHAQGWLMCVCVEIKGSCEEETPVRERDLVVSVAV